MSSPAHSANPAGATHDAVLLGFFRPPRRSLFVMHLPGREPLTQGTPHPHVFYDRYLVERAERRKPAATSSRGAKGRSVDNTRGGGHYGMPPSGVDSVRSR